MTHVLVSWILLSLLVGFFGRHGRAGFWGAFFFSLLFTPLAGALAVLVTGPSRSVRRAQAQLAASPRRAAAMAGRPYVVVRTSTGISGGLLIRWIALIAVFTGLFLLIDGTVGESGRFQTALRVSLDAGTFGVVAANVTSAQPIARVLFGLERLLALGLLVVTAGRTVGGRYDATLEQLRAAAYSRDQHLQELQAIVRSQQVELDRLRAMVAVPPPPSISHTLHG